MGATEREPPTTREPARPLIRRLVWVRRFSQAAFFALFCYLLCKTTFRGTFAASVAPVRLPVPVEGFFFADPLAALLTLLSTHTVYRGLLWSLAVVVLTALLGRVFCGWICPLGSLHHFVGWLWPSRYGKGARRIAQNRAHPLRQRVKHYLLYAALGAAALGSAVGGLLDPISLAVRSLAVAVLPAAQYAVRAATGAAEGTGLRSVQTASGAVSDLLAATLWPARQAYFYGGWLIGALFVALLVLGRFVPRFWCRVLCPLGALLGALSRFSLLGLEKRQERCTSCNDCLLHCQGADSPEGGVPWRQHDCHVCLNCEAACPEGAIRFRFLPRLRDAERTPDVVRRTALASAAAGAVLVPLLRASGGLDRGRDPRLIRPPGALDERALLERCIRCGECLKICPNGALHPALFEAGIEGLWTPLLIARLGYCEPSCVLCSDVCPTGALRKITEEDKLGLGRAPVRIGTAFVDRGRCLPWAMARPCTVCEEFCPTSPKAIWIEPAQEPARLPGPPGEPQRLATAAVGRPHVDPGRCIGCGACEHLCPVRGAPAIYVTSDGETRSRASAILLGEGG
ncbi:MAG: 4Fe-4S binding protein [Deltaproteobacteria bacterium]|nr:4Fe-4S binding protein [Deltaproteobacteria bacterium]